ncbi:uncharacterized protein LOC131244216 [Magnolia sinica]|uniref:uncharacterized protein LOC131244216 n=1 Tax=Magnolia sinica TaxID=86752 RepID=UPI00265949F1|nr:uncharacterized protein LOC131244216 [Magnolia sinica]
MGMEIFSWKLLHGVVPADVNIQAKGIYLSSRCNCCSESPNRIPHLQALYVAGRWNQWWPAPTQVCSSKSNRRLAPLIIFWEIWKARNACHFDGTPVLVPAAIGQISWWLSRISSAQSKLPNKGLCSSSGNYFAGGQSKLRAQRHCRFQFVRWVVPSSGWFKLNIDGSSCGNPGLSGGGGLCRNDSGALIFAFYVGYGMGSNNRAELRAVRDSLSLCRSFGLSTVEVETDSKLVANMLNGRSHPSWIWNPWLKRIKNFKRLGTFVFIVIPREGNAPADSLACSGRDL